jgi:hypothetical protein
MMHININDRTKIGDIENAFSNFYPYLEIHFYISPHKSYERSAEKERIASHVTVSEIKKTHTDGILEIHPDYKVISIEKELYQKFGLSAQILRKEKDTLIQTTGEDDFTIKELNLFGRNASDEFILEEEDIDTGEEKPEKLL